MGKTIRNFDDRATVKGKPSAKELNRAKRTVARICPSLRAFNEADLRNLSFGTISQIGGIFRNEEGGR